MCFWFDIFVVNYICNMQQRSFSGGSSQSPRSPSSRPPYLSVSVTDPARMGNGVQAYISYKVITKVSLCVHMCIYQFQDHWVGDSR